MYTEDDKNTKHRYKNDNARSKVKNNNHIYANSTNYGEDYYRDYCCDRCSDNYNLRNLHKRKYMVIIIIISIILGSLLLVLFRSINIS